MRLLIAGLGDLGRTVAQRLLADGHEVHGLNRSGDPRGLHALNMIRADLTEPGSLRGLDRFEAVLCCATPGARTEDAYRKIFIDGTRALHQATGPHARWVFVSSTAVHGANDGRWVDESCAPDPVAFNGRVLAEAEAEVHRMGGRILRLAGIYGPGREALRRRLTSPDSSCRSDPPWYTNRIHIDDAAMLAERMLTTDQAPSCVIGVDACPAPECEVLGWLADHLGLPQPVRLTHAQGSNKRLRSLGIPALGVELNYPDFRRGYASLWPRR